MGKMSKVMEKSYHQENVEPPPRKQQSEVGDSGRGKGPAGAAEKKPAHSSAPFGRERWDRRLQLSAGTNSLFFESFRRLRASIMYPSSGKRPKTILVTSAAPHEGKGFVCANLGIALSQGMDNHVIMVDCDLRHPTLAGVFGVSGNTGLVDYLQEDVELSMLIRKTGQPKLSLIPGGHPPKNPAELLESSKMTSLISELAGRYSDRFVLFDSPPEIVASETGTLAKSIDGVVLVVRYGVSKKDHLKKFAEALGKDKILGVVFNGFPENSVGAFLEKKLGYGYGYGYYHYEYAK